MSDEKQNEQRHAAYAVQRFVRATYRVAVEALLVNGEARGRVLSVLSEPAFEEMAEVYGTAHEQPGRLDEVSFVGGIPGEVVDVEVSWRLPVPGRKRSRRIPPPEVRVKDVIESSYLRVTPHCVVFGACGGCQFQHLSYAAQLVWKAERVRDVLHAAGFTNLPIETAIGCEPPWEYRNHMRFSINREGRAGLTARNSHRVLPLRSCPIASPHINAVLTLVADVPLPRPQMVVRCSDLTGHTLVQPAPTPELQSRLQAHEITVRETEMEERLLDTPFRIRPSSFFQTNTRQANRMAELVLAGLPQGEKITLVDAYCGVGTFARLMADRVGRVIAIEESASAIRDARWNLREVGNVEIIQGKVEEMLPEMSGRLDGLVIDPPRAGCQRPVLDALLARHVPSVVYVSCNPDTLARDLAYLCLQNVGYVLRSVHLLDMFPQTAHVESVAILEAL
ncbi:MAG: RNA methyltransferase, TrmA family [Ktedonobacterales bacterium]|jgi:23S rRNA (uracil1939-C5)-methyltransferase|nr:MAG: RNA methyltransferase, TrmA family [Ktedonobacterales bacterium]